MLELKNKTKEHEIGEVLADINIKVFKEVMKHLKNPNNITYRDLQFVLFKGKLTITIKDGIDNLMSYIKNFDLKLKFNFNKIDEKYLNCRIGMRQQKKFSEIEEKINHAYLLRLVQHDIY